MREILFRGKRTDNGEWVEGFIVTSRENTYPNGFEMITVDGINYDELDNYIPDFISYAVDPSTVGQYTGLKDKNGKRIFEWDIVNTDKFSEPNKQYIIKYDLQFGAFIGQDRYNVYFVTFDGDSGEFEVIGNIHDNPELLEK